MIVATRKKNTEKETYIQKILETLSIFFETLSILMIKKSKQLAFR